LTFLQDENARTQVISAVVRHLEQLRDAQQLNFSKSILLTSEQLIGTPEAMKANSKLILSLIEALLCQKVIGNTGQDLLFFQVLCRNLMNLLLSASNEKTLTHRTDTEKAQSFHRKEA
jgi:hypothetical protein